MNGKKGSIEIIIDPSATKAKVPAAESEKNIKSYCNAWFSLKGWILRVWTFAKEDINRVVFSLKVGLAVLLVSLLMLIRAPYEMFGTNIIWSILTVAVMFEYTVGSTFNRGFNRALGSLLAGVLAIAIAQLALSTGRVAEPIIIGLSIFLVGVITSFMKLWPSLVPYEYGFRVILFTYCLIIVSGYRMGNPLRTAMDRLYSIGIGAIVAVIVNVLIIPVWAGEQLHKELVNIFNSVADSLEECVQKYLEGDESKRPEFSKAVMDDFPDEPAYKKCRSTLNSSSKLENLANSAKWEPPHGRFKNFFYPWAEYVKVGAVLRSLAYEVMALHGVLHSEIQAPHYLKITFQKEIQEATTQAAELLRSLGKDMSNMRWSLKTALLNQVHSSTERLEQAIHLHSYRLTPLYEIPDNLSKQQTTLSSTFSLNLSDPSNGLSEVDPKPETYHETMRKQSRRLYSWPSREVVSLDLEEERGCAAECMPKLHTIESTTTLSLATFTSLLIEFVARLDLLVEAVDRLSKISKFTEDL